jgi:hypothetical protein
VDYDLTNLNVDSTLQVQVSGPSYLFPQMEIYGSPLVAVRLERRQYSDATDELGWETIATTMLPPVHQFVEKTVWQGTISLPSPMPHPLRIVVMEAELFRADETVSNEAMERILGPEVFSRGADGSLSGTSDSGRGVRVVFVDELIVP